MNPPPPNKFAMRVLHSSEFCLGLFNIACFFTEASHNPDQRISYILKPPAFQIPPPLPPFQKFELKTLICMEKQRLHDF
jgi:hypothetical protein